MTRRKWIVWTAVAGAALVAALAATDRAHAAKKAKVSRLSLNPYGVILGGGATLAQTGYDGPLALPAANASFGIGFTLPADYRPGGDVILEILWETAATSGNFGLSPNFQFRARDGTAQDVGNAAGGLTALDATTTFTLGGGGGITFDVPATAHQTATVRFRITGGDGEFPTLAPGDALNFGLYRQAGTAADTLFIAGMSVVYSRK